CREGKERNELALRPTFWKKNQGGNRELPAAAYAVFGTRVPPERNRPSWSPQCRAGTARHPGRDNVGRAGGVSPRRDHAEFRSDNRRYGCWQKFFRPDD